MNVILIATITAHLTLGGPQSGVNLPSRIHAFDHFQSMDSCAIARDMFNDNKMKTIGFGIPSAPSVSYHHAECYVIPEKGNV